MLGSSGSYLLFQQLPQREQLPISLSDEQERKQWIETETVGTLLGHVTCMFLKGLFGHPNTLKISNIGKV